MFQWYDFPNALVNERRKTNKAFVNGCCTGTPAVTPAATLFAFQRGCLKTNDN